MSAIDIRGLGKHYAGTDVLRQVDLTIDEGEFIVLVGPSGCGKSTLLRIIAGLEDISEGELYIGGLLSNAVKARARNVAMVFQSYALYPHMTVEENIGFALKVAGLSKAERHRRVRDVAKSLGLEQLLQRKPKALSGGQRQRVAIGRAIVRHPKVFLMDEPLSNLDAKLRVEMRAEMRALHARLGVTTVYVTHDQVEALTLGSRVAVLRPIGESGNTNIQQFATPTELFERPHNVFVAGFMGSPPMNILLARLVRRDGTFEISMGDIAIALPQAAQNQALADTADRADGQYRHRHAAGRHRRGAPGCGGLQHPYHRHGDAGRPFIRLVFRQGAGGPLRFRLRGQGRLHVASGRELFDKDIRAARGPASPSDEGRSIPRHRSRAHLLFRRTIRTGARQSVVRPSGESLAGCRVKQMDGSRVDGDRG